MTTPGIPDRCRETSVTTGTGPLSLAGAGVGYRTLVAGLAGVLTCYYVIHHRTADEWETGIGTVADGAPDTLTRTTVHQSSNAGALVNLSAGTKDVFIDATAHFLDVAKSRTHLLSVPPDAALGRTGDTAIDLESGYGYEKLAGVWTLRGQLQGSPAPAAGTYLVSGGQVAWVSGYTFRVGAATYYINGTLYSSVEQPVTLDAADATNDRKDVIVLDTAGLVDNVTGEASTPAAEPVLDPELQVKVTAVDVAAASGAAAVTQTDVYKENAEWIATTTAPTRITLASASNPRAGALCIQATAAVAGDRMEFTIPAAGTLDPNTQDALVLFVRVDATWPATKALRFSWRSGTAARGTTLTVSNGTLGFNTGQLGSYQIVVLPISAFASPSGQTATKLRIEVVGGGIAISFRLDDIVLQAGQSAAPPTEDQVGLLWRGIWQSTVAYAARDMVRRNSTPWVAVSASVGKDPELAANASFWERADVEERGLTAEFGDSVASAPAAAMIAGGRWPFRGRLSAIYLDTLDGLTATCQLDVKKNGTSIFGAGSTKPLLTAGTAYSDTAFAGTVTRTHAKGDKLTVHLESFSGASKGLALTLLSNEDEV